MRVKVSALFLLVVGCCGIQWKPLSDFKDNLKEYSAAATDTISSIENILDKSKKDSESFLNNTYANYPVIRRIPGMSSSDKCLTGFIDEEKLRVSFQIQIYQLQIPLFNRVEDIRERLNYINSTLDIYQGLAESKYQSCKSLNGNCLEETNQWLESSISSLSCAVYSNCSSHSIRKRSTCSFGQFLCRNGGYCIHDSHYCDGRCNCGSNCEDEPSGCVRNCIEFRCKITFKCVPKSTKCNGVDDCGDMSDEVGCPPPTTTPTPSTTLQYTHLNCSIDAGDFLCENKNCISLEQVCDGYNDCGDSSDETDHCKEVQCSSECGKKGGVCLRGPEGAKCLYECPPGTYETTKGCSTNPEPPLATLIQVLEDTPRLLTRYAARVKYLKAKTTLALSKSLREVVKCKKDEFRLLSKVIDFSTMQEVKVSPNVGSEEVPVVGINATSSSTQAP